VLYNRPTTIDLARISGNYSNVLCRDEKSNNFDSVSFSAGFKIRRRKVCRFESGPGTIEENQALSQTNPVWLFAFWRFSSIYVTNFSAS
jgi:hypothetical protein